MVVVVVVLVCAGAPAGVEGVVVGALGYQDEVGDAEIDRQPDCCRRERGCEGAWGGG